MGFRSSGGSVTGVGGGTAVIDTCYFFGLNEDSEAAAQLHNIILYYYIAERAVYIALYILLCV